MPGEYEFDIEVRVGRTDGFRYFAIKPPLTEEEVADLRNTDIGHLFAAIEQIDTEPACSQVRVAATEQGRIANLAERIGGLVHYIRDGSMHIDTRPVELLGAGSSPFNPRTE